MKPKLNDFITKSVAIASNKEVDTLLAWGMRSNAFADHLIENGFEKVYVIEKVQSFPQLCSTVLSNL
jgi:tRNA 2-selenouridine synthase